MKFSRAGIFLIPFVVMLSACTAADPNAGSEHSKSSQAVTQSAPTPQLGKPFTIMQSNGVAKITIISAKYGAKDGGALNSHPANGGYLTLDVLWQATSGTTEANMLYINAKDANGRRGDDDVFAPQLLGSGEVNAGDKLRGNVVYDIGKGPWTIIVTNELLQEQVRLTIKASQLTP